jgi:hypothetical protein
MINLVKATPALLVRPLTEVRCSLLFWQHKSYLSHIPKTFMSTRIMIPPITIHTRCYYCFILII